jgi:serine/threonine-protein kinase 11
MLYCMMFEKFPFNGDTAQAIKEKIINAEFKIPDNAACTEEVVDLLKNMLHKDPNLRYDLMSIRNHKWMLLSDSAV